MTDISDNDDIDINHDFFEKFFNIDNNDIFNQKLNENNNNNNDSNNTVNNNNDCLDRRIQINDAYQQSTNNNHVNSNDYEDGVNVVPPASSSHRQTITNTKPQDKCEDNKDDDDGDDDNKLKKRTNKKRKLKEVNKSKGAKEKKPKKRRSQFQRKNIKKLLTDNKLNESTLRALQEEKDRQKRLHDQLIQQQQLVLVQQQQQIHHLNTNLTEIKSGSESDGEDDNDDDEDEEDETSGDEEDEGEKKGESLSRQESLIKEEPSSSFVVKEESTVVEAKKDSSDDCICLDDSKSDNEVDVKSNIVKSENTNQSVYNFINTNGAHSRIKVINEDEDGDDDDDDIQIISENEVNDDIDEKINGLHTNDELNVPDSKGRVLVNVNHPVDDPDIYLSDFIAKRIKPHQIGGVRFMYTVVIETLERVKVKYSGFGCILAHSMGLGKTLQVVAFVDVILRFTGLKYVLCIVPINTIQNWMSEFNSWLPDNKAFNVYLVNDNVKTFQQRSDIILQWRSNGGVLLIGYEMFRMLVSTEKPKKRKTVAKKPSQTDVCIDLEEEDRQTDIQKKVQDALLGPDLVVCDEGHRIKNNSANISKSLKCIQTKRRVVLTGYPLQNNLIEYWCMVDFIRPSYLGTKSEFCNMFERPITNGQCVDSTIEDKRLMRSRSYVLHKLLKGFVQRRNHDVFIKTLPPKEEFVILVRLTNLQKELYLAFMQSLRAISFREKQNPIRCFALAFKIWNHPDILYDFIKNKDKYAENDLDLPEFSQNKQNKQQQQQQQRQSANTLSQQSSLSLQQSASSDDIIEIFDASNFQSTKSTDDYDWATKLLDNYQCGDLSNGAKFMISFSLINDSICHGDKILLFSQSLLTLNQIEKYLSKMIVPNTNDKWEKNKSYLRLDGSTSGLERERLINLFNVKNNGIWLFLLSTRAGGLGINLVGANRVIIFDASFNPCHDAQAVCRVFRYGQTKNCYIYRLIADHTMEKKIYDRQINKQTTADRVIDEIQCENHFTKMEIENLIHFVEEDVLPADLSHMPQKYTDTVLINSCLCNQFWITKEPFKHESLLLDKKEYRLSYKEKKDAENQYNFEKRHLNNINNARAFYDNQNFQSSSSLFHSQHTYNRTNSTLYSMLDDSKSLFFDNRNGPSHNHNHNNHNINNNNNNNNNNSMMHSKTFYSTSDIANNSNSNNSLNYVNSNNNLYQNQYNHHHQQPPPPYQQQQQQQQQQRQQPPQPTYQQQPQIQTNRTNDQNNVNQAISSTVKSDSNELNSDKCTIKRYTSTKAFEIPTNDGRLTILPGEQVVIITTPKGRYFKAPNGKFLAFRNSDSTNSNKITQNTATNTDQQAQLQTQTNNTLNNTINNQSTLNTLISQAPSSSFLKSSSSTNQSTHNHFDSNYSFNSDDLNFTNTSHDFSDLFDDSINDNNTNNLNYNNNNNNNNSNNNMNGSSNNSQKYQQKTNLFTNYATSNQ